MSLSAPALLQILLGLITLLAAAKVLGWLGRRLQLPTIFGELLAGVLLGPTVLGRFAPEWSRFLAGGSDAAFANQIIHLSLLIFLFSAGTEIAVKETTRHLRASLLVALSGWALSFALGLLVLAIARPWAHSVLAGSAIGDHFWQLALFFATALSISAVPVIAKTLMDLGLYKTRMGSITMTAAVATDIFAWMIFALIGGGGGHGLSALFAFVAGVAMSFSRTNRGGSFDRLLGSAAEFARRWLAPLFFASVGLRADFIAHFDLVTVLLVFTVACAGKIFGCGLAARMSGLPSREAWSVGFALNARGAMEIILGIAAFEARLISPLFFVALVIMALATSLMSGPMIRRLVIAPKGFLHEPAL